MLKAEYHANQQNMPLVQLGFHDDQDKQRLVNNYSVNSFMNGENNEWTITRSFDRKYSTMHFKPAEKNRVDIVVTQGEYPDSAKDFLHQENFSSQDIRREYRGKAKCLLTLVFVLLFLMLGILLVCLFRASGHENPNYEVRNNSKMLSGYIIPTLRIQNNSFSDGNFTSTTTGGIVGNLTGDATDGS